MRGREIDISLSDMKDWTPLERRSDTMKVTALHTGEIVLGAELRRCISNKLQILLERYAYSEISGTSILI